MKRESVVHVPTWQDYPCSDGEPMADNAWQFDWISMLKWELEYLFRHNPDVLVAGDMFWYPLAEDKGEKLAPDVFVAFGRPKFRRDSYMQWMEGGQPPQVVIEVLSPSNKPDEMKKKREFYEKYGVEEYYIFDTYVSNHSVEGWIRQQGKLVPIENIEGWVSPRLNIRIEIEDEEVWVFHPNGDRFLGPGEKSIRLEAAEQLLSEREEDLENERHARQEQFSLWQEERQKRREESKRADRERALREQETQRADQERALREQERGLREQITQRAEQAEARNVQLAEKLRALGIDPDAPPT